MGAGRPISSSVHMALVAILGLTFTVVMGALFAPAVAVAQGDLPPGYTDTPSGPLGPADRDLIVRVRLAGLWEMPAGDMAREKGRSEERRVGKECRSRWS